MPGITPKYELRIIVDPPIAGKVDGAGKYADGKKVQVEVTTFDGWKFIGWAGEWPHSEQSFPVEMTKDITATATFKKIFKLSAAFITLFLTSAFFFSTTIACIYRINQNEKKLNELKLNELKLNTEKNNLIQKINSLNTEKSTLVTNKEDLEKQNKKLDGETRELNKKIEVLEKAKIYYESYENTLTVLNPQNDYKIYIKAGQIVDAYLFDTTADADIWIFDSNSKEMARGSTSDVISNFVVPSDGTYTFVVWKNVTKYKLKVYIRN